MYTTLLVAAILPVIILLIAIYKADKIEKEPIGKLIVVFVFGALSVLPASSLEMLMSSHEPDGAVVGGLYKGYCVAGLCEEFVKICVLFIFVWHSRHFDEYFDGIVYAVYASMGFACVENVMYVFSTGSLSTAAMRAILSVPGHFLFAVTMGYYFALAKFASNRRGRYLVLAFLFPVLLHGTFDALLMIPEGMEDEGLRWMVASVLFVVFIIFDIKMWKWGMRRIHRLQYLSEEQGASVRNAFDGFHWDV